MVPLESSRQDESFESLFPVLAKKKFSLAQGKVTQKIRLDERIPTVLLLSRLKVVKAGFLDF